MATAVEVSTLVLEPRRMRASSRRGKSRINSWNHSRIPLYLIVSTQNLNLIQFNQNKIKIQKISWDASAGGRCNTTSKLRNKKLLPSKNDQKAMDEISKVSWGGLRTFRWSTCRQMSACRWFLADFAKKNHGHGNRKKYAKMQKLIRATSMQTLNLTLRI